MELSIQDLGALGEFVGGIAVIVTLIYVAVQLRQTNIQTSLSTQVARAQASSSIHTRWMEITMRIAENPELRRVMSKRLPEVQSISEMDADEVAVLGLVLNSMLLIAQDAYIMRKQGIAPEEDQTADFRFIKVSLLLHPAIQEWWQTAKDTGAYGDDFRDEINAEIETRRATG